MTAPRYVCGTHLDQPVTWKGTGCPACAVAEEERRRAQTAGHRRQAALDALDAAISRGELS